MRTPLLFHGSSVLWGLYAFTAWTTGESVASANNVASQSWNSTSDLGLRCWKFQNWHSCIERLDFDDDKRPKCIGNAMFNKSLKFHPCRSTDHLAHLYFHFASSPFRTFIVRPCCSRHIAMLFVGCYVQLSVRLCVCNVIVMQLVLANVLAFWQSTCRYSVAHKGEVHCCRR